MALNLKTLGTRSLSAAVFVVLLIGSLLWNYYSFSIFFFVVAMLALGEFYTISEKLGARPYKLCGYAIAVTVYALAVNTAYLGITLDYSSRYMTWVLLLSTFVILAVALFSRRTNPLPNALYTLLGLVYAVLPFALLHRLVVSGGDGNYIHEYNPQLLLGIVLLIWSNDTFAYLCGSLFGKNKMIERISPGKTWEGTVSGVIITFFLSYLLSVLLTDTQFVNWQAVAVIVPVLATVGDLVESMLKRQAGVKDSGNLMPGHGGALDRFDSLIFVTPFVVVLLPFL